MHDTRESLHRAQQTKIIRTVKCAVFIVADRARRGCDDAAIGGVQHAIDRHALDRRDVLLKGVGVRIEHRMRFVRMRSNQRGTGKSNREHDRKKRLQQGINNRHIRADRRAQALQALKLLGVQAVGD